MRVIYVDDEDILLENFRLTAKGLSRIDTLHTFNSSKAALAWARENLVDVAFLDIEMPVMNGIELARCLKKLDENIRIIFVTAFEQYALQAFGVDAVGYLLKPYLSEDIDKQLKKASYIKSIPKKEIQIQTMPDFVIRVNGEQLKLGNTKQEELMAFLVDRGENGVTKRDAVSCLWQGYSSDSIYWTTMSRLKAILEKAEIADIIVTNGQRKCINTDMVECDLYQMLKGEASAIENYKGEYLKRFSWAEERNAQLSKIKKESIKKL